MTQCHYGSDQMQLTVFPFQKKNKKIEQLFFVLSPAHWDLD